MGYFKLKSDINKLRKLQALRSELQLQNVLALKKSRQLTPEKKFEIMMQELVWHQCNGNRFI